MSSAAGGFTTGRLWSLLEMLELDAKEFVELIHVISRGINRARGKQGDLSEFQLKNRDEGIEETIRRLTKLELPVSIKAAQGACSSTKTQQGLSKALGELENIIVYELDGRKFYGPLSKYAEYYDQAQLFGAEVFAAFPSANDDIFEAGMCLAFERGTACVMHLMRVLEAGLAALAAAVNVGPQNDWGAYLRKIDQELETRQKASGARTPDEQFYAEISTHLGHMRVAWRNPTMHVEKTYSPERAEDILTAVRSFMKHVATRISEKP